MHACIADDSSPPRRPAPPAAALVRTSARGLRAAAPIDQASPALARRRRRPGRPGECDVRVRRPAGRDRVAPSHRPRGAGRARTCAIAMDIWPARMRIARPTSMASSATRRSAPCCRSAAAGAAAACSLTSISTPSPAIRRSWSGSATSRRCCLRVHAKTGLVTFHGPNGMGRWDAYSLDYFKRMLMNGEPITFEKPA